MLPLHKYLTISAGLLVWLASGVPPALAATPGECPQPRFTAKAPDEYYARTIPSAPSAMNPQAAKPIFEGKSEAANCVICHGRKGDGKGVLAGQFEPPPRNFTCARTVKGVTDGQLFWIIRFGSPGTAMPPHSSLNDEQVWQLVAYLRQLAI